MTPQESTTKTSKPQSSQAATTAQAQPKAAAKSPADRAREVAQTAVDVPVGTVLQVSDRVAELVEPFTARASAERKLRSYRTQVRRSVKRAEHRGASARRRAASEARKTRNRVEREARKRRQRVETELKRNRKEVEQRVRRTIDEISALR